ncbi:MAG TPA: hypothetical protein VFT01_06600 [Homoserinimonas sp.]|nr:hypothetical protein [Homoserinimonas sp.]
MTAHALVVGATSDPSFFFFAAVGLALESFFVRVLIEIHKERRSS